MDSLYPVGMPFIPQTRLAPAFQYYSQIPPYSPQQGQPMTTGTALQPIDDYNPQPPSMLQQNQQLQDLFQNSQMPQLQMPQLQAAPQTFTSPYTPAMPQIPQQPQAPAPASPTPKMPIVQNQQAAPQPQQNQFTYTPVSQYGGFGATGFNMR